MATNAGHPVADQQQHVLEPCRGVGGVQPQDEPERQQPSRSPADSGPDAPCTPEGLQRQRPAVVVHHPEPIDAKRDDQQRQPAEEPSAHDRPDALGGVLGHQFARRDADALHEDVRGENVRRT